MDKTNLMKSGKRLMMILISLLTTELRFWLSSQSFKSLLRRNIKCSSELIFFISCINPLSFDIKINTLMIFLFKALRVSSSFLLFSISVISVNNPSVSRLTSSKLFIFNILRKEEMSSFSMICVRNAQQC